MNPILAWGIHLIIAIQHSAPWLQAPAQFFSFLGNEEFFFFVLPLLYWCVDVRLGVRVAIILTLSNSVNSFFKLVQTRREMSGAVLTANRGKQS